ncbi:MAG TPA: TetR/AcrR family transcriptional regulator [Xanthobacteraceae bacterium]|nr:TetR/AcrR family transcriptional regulator [Xanthobacteraceae bacterium]
MVQKDKPRRGRPRAYDPDRALAQATAAFWDAGYAGTSLDDLSAATGMNRPSLYGAFGDKHTLYLKAIEGYRAVARAGMQTALPQEGPLKAALGGLYQRAISLYLSGEHGPRGCLLVSTAATEAVMDAEIRRAARAALEEIDAAFEARFRHAREQGDLPRSTDPAALAKLASAVLHMLSIRARIGTSRAVLEQIAASGVDLICGPGPTARRKAPPG